MAALRRWTGPPAGAAIVYIGGKCDAGLAALRRARRDATRLTLTSIADLVGAAGATCLRSSASATVGRVGAGGDAAVSTAGVSRRALTVAALAKLSGAARHSAGAAIERIARQIRAGERASLEAFATDRALSSAAAEKSKKDNRDQGSGGWPPPGVLAIRTQERHVRLPLSPSEREGQAAIACRALGQVSWLSDRPQAPLRRQPSEPPTFPRALRSKWRPTEVH